MENLKIRVEDVSSVSKKLFFEIPYEKVQSEIENAFLRLSQTVVVKGFRKGKAPRSVIEKKYSESIKVDVTDKLINESFSYAVKEHELEPAGYPMISGVSFKEKEPFSFEVLIETRPTIEPVSYTGLNLETFTSEPTDEEVDKIVSSFLEQHASMKTIDVERASIAGDWVDINLQGYIEDEKRDDLSAKAYVCQIGDNKGLMEELDKSVIGMKIGEEKDIKFSYPEDFHAVDLKGKKASFNIKLNRIMEKVLPELTDELIKEAGSKDSKEVFLEGIRNNLKRRKEEAKHNDLRAKAIDHLLEKNNFDVPASEVERRLPELRDRAVANIYGSEGPGVMQSEVEDLLSKNEDVFRKAAEKEVRLLYIVEAISKKENILVSKEEVEEEMSIMAASLSLSVDSLKKKYGEYNIFKALEHSIIERKTFKFITDNSTVVEKKELV